MTKKHFLERQIWNDGSLVLWFAINIYPETRILFPSSIKESPTVYTTPSTVISPVVSSKEITTDSPLVVTIVPDCPVPRDESNCYNCTYENIWYLSDELIYVKYKEKNICRGPTEKNTLVP